MFVVCTWIVDCGSEMFLREIFCTFASYMSGWFLCFCAVSVRCVYSGMGFILSDLSLAWRPAI